VTAIIVILGHARVGKDTAGNWIADAGNGSTLAFADRLKEICGELYGLSYEDMYTDEGKRRVTRFSRGVGVDSQGHAHDRYWTVREILQHFGTEGCRAVDPDVWVRIALDEARVRLTQRYAANHGDVVAITDGRFRSECEGVWKAGGEVWRIRRPGANGAVGIANHQSETEQDGIRDDECQAVIENDSTIEVFKERVLSAFSSWKARHANS
jgi:hypothetical protein